MICTNRGSSSSSSSSSSSGGACFQSINWGIFYEISSQKLKKIIQYINHIKVITFAMKSFL